jgi:aminoglycoside phosphotransferase (APT) family kinase protein
VERETVGTMENEIAPIVERELRASPDSIEQIEEGLLHETYEISCDGEEYVLQLSSEGDEGEADALRRGLNCYVMLQDTEVPVPAIVTEEIRAFDRGWYSLVEKLPGKTGKLDISPRKVRNAARYLAKIHDVRSFETSGWVRFEDREPSIRPFQDGSLRRWILRTVEETSTTLGDGGIESAGSALERVFEREGAALPDEFAPVFCHNDFTPDNVLFENEEVVGILDFDRAHASHAQRDLVKAANGFWMHDPGAEWDVQTTFYEGYREVGELDGSFASNEPLYRVETLAWTVAGLLELDELSAYEKEFYTEKLLAAIDRIEDVSP